jgi:outer membrane receptor for ferric coprogen and ferric-rhodotorulic acid
MNRCADFTREREQVYETDIFGLGPPLPNVYSFDPEMYPDPRKTASPSMAGYSQYTLDQYGGFIVLQINLPYAWSLSSGVRVASDTQSTYLSFDPGGANAFQASMRLGNSGVLQPYDALMYRINEHFSWYASAADVYLGQYEPYLGADGKSIGAQHGITFESGAKGAWREGALNAYLAVYRIEQRNIPIIETKQPSSNPYCCFSTGAGRSRGVELGIDGELAPGWQIGSGYTYNMDTSGTPDLPVTSTPRHLLKIWTNARLTGAFSAWTIGGSLRAQSTPPGAQAFNCEAQTQNCGVSVVATTWPYAVFDLRTGYRLNAHWQVALNVNNIGDKRYYLSQNTPVLSVWYGEPRNFMLRIDAKY